MKYQIGDSLRINIKGYTEDIAANVDEDGNINPINLYIIDPADDGRPRYISEEVLDAIMQMGADCYHSTFVEHGMNEEDDLVEIGEIIPGTTIEVGGIQMEILDITYPSTNGEKGILCLAKDILFEKAFDEDNCNNWLKSSLRKYLNGEYKNEIESRIGEDALMPFSRDLTSDDGMTDYCKEPCVDSVSLISCDEYRTYREHISNKSDWWWTLTPWSCLASYSYRERFVYSDGSLTSGSAFDGSYGVSPAFLLLPSLRVKIIENEED